MFGKTRVLKNSLTDLIERGSDVTIIDILLHKELSNTLRGESDILYSKLFNDKCEWFEKILRFALFEDDEVPEKYSKLNGVHQISHNASNFLENVGKKFAAYCIKSSDIQSILDETINKFISEKQSNQNRMFAGHFQRFFDNFFRWKAFDDIDKMLDKVIPFLIKNSRILAYQQLISRLLCDYTGNIDSNKKYSLISQMLFYSYQAVNYIRTQNGNQFQDANNVVENKFELNEQPINSMRQPIPLLTFEFNCLNRIPSSNSGNLDINWDENPNIDIAFKDIEDAELLGYLLISSIRTSVYEQSDIIDFFRNDENANYRLIQSVFYCAIRSDVKSLIGLESFRLLEIIFDGIPVMDVDKWKNSEPEKLSLDFYQKYADELIYDAEKPNLKMIQALPILWNHRYNTDKYKMNEDELRSVDVSDYYSNKKEKTRKREKGETAFEILQPCLLSEPPISSMLIHNGVKIFLNILSERKELRLNSKQTDQILDSMVYLDGIVIDFFKHHFKFGNNPDINMCDLFQQIIPLPSIDKYFSDEADHMMRTPLNGFLLDLFLRLYNTNDNSNMLFDVNDDLSFTSIAHCKETKAFDCFEYLILSIKDATKVSALPHDVIYNYSGNNNYGDDNEEEEENQARIELVGINNSKIKPM